jgi:LysM repeat protein
MRVARAYFSVLIVLLACTLMPGTAAAQSGSSYVVKAGDTLLSIALANGTSVEAIIAANGLADPDMIWNGQVLTIPGGSPPGTGASNLTNYTVKPGDSLGTIALAHGISIGALMSANSLSNANLIQMGQVLKIPAPAPIQSSTSSIAPTNTYTVKLGDSLGSIARDHGVSMNALIKANELTDADMLYVGQRLTIPGAAAQVPVQTPSMGQVLYTVKPGDTLGQIALRYGTTAAVIARINGLSSPDWLSVGIQLAIPVRSTAPMVWPGKATRFVASISQQRCWLYQANHVIADWTCSTGRPGAESKPGNYKIQSRMEKAYGSTWNIWMPYWMGIYWAGSTENGIHGIPYDAVHGGRMWEGLVGTPITFGCIMLKDEHVRMLYDLAYIGMPVIIVP